MSAQYQIKIKGQLDPDLSVWFGNFAVVHTPEGDTLLTGTVVDQAALHGILARCRDMGVTLISINPLQMEDKMNQIHTAVSHVIDARPEEIYAVISDYHVGHPAILPKPYFTYLNVEKGGKGEGTVINFGMKVMGVEARFHSLVTEPQPGRVLKETEINTGQFSTFTLEPLEGGAQTRVTIATHFAYSRGFAGFMEKLINPPVARRIFKKELLQLADYVRSNRSN